VNRTFVALLFFALSACAGGERPHAEPSPEANGAPPPTVAPARAASSPEPAPAEPTAEPTAEELPVPEDFQAEAEREITRENFRAQLAALEKDLGATDALPPKPKRTK
jgi:hypothetical protein